MHQVKNEYDCVIIGAGSAGLSAATLFAQKDAHRFACFEAHTQAGGCAGYFARGFPKRFHDAGATQLIEVTQGRFQQRLLDLAQADLCFNRGHPSHIGTSHSGVSRVQRIGEIHHFFPEHSLNASPEPSLKLSSGSSIGADYVLRADGKVCNSSGLEIKSDQFRNLQNFLKACARDAEWMWKLFYNFPQFPLKSINDLLRAFNNFTKIPFRAQLKIPGLIALDMETAAKNFGLQKGTIAWKMFEGLLLDTAQSIPKETPYLIGAMGLSILGRGIYRYPQGMAELFIPWSQGVQRLGLSIFTNTKVLSLETTSSYRWSHSAGRGGYRLLVQHGGQASGHGSAKSAVTEVFSKSVVCTIPMRDMMNLVPLNDLLTQTTAWSKWRKTVNEGFEWKAFALYAVAYQDSNSAIVWFKSEMPFYCQIFPLKNELLVHALYCSFSGLQRDQRTGRQFRTLTATIHVPPHLKFDLDCDAEFDAEFDSQVRNERNEIREQLIQRIVSATGVSLQAVEDASPSTFAYYTNRSEGFVGGFAASFERFLFQAPPSVAEPFGERERLVLAGDSVFPGQGVVASSLSGVLAWSRVTGEDPAKLGFSVPLS